MLEIDRINGYYGDVPILRDLSLRVLPGEIVTVVGPNGSGKSTLLKTIVQILPLPKHSPGKILYQGKDLSRYVPEDLVNLGIAIVPEGARLFPEMTILENLQMGSYAAAARRRRLETLEEVFSLFPRLRERREQKAKTLSGGERQMLAIGRALMGRPSLLLLDEPSLGLQPLLVTKTFEAVAEVNRRGVSVLMVEQNIQFALEISHRAYVLENGRIVMEGTGAELLGKEYIKKFYLAL
jgi:branched-chain amino acid transport system ATP-binding protein